MVKKNSRIIDILTIVLYISLFLISSESFNGRIVSYGAAIISLLIVVVSATINAGKVQVKLTSLHVWMAVFIAFCYLSSIWAIQPDLAISKGNTILKNVICIVLVYMHFQRMDSVKDLLKVTMYGGYIVVLLSVAFFGISSLTDIVASSGRMEAGFLNQNTLGMLAAFTIIVNIYFIIYYKEQVFLIPILALAVIVLAAAGSRKGIIELVAGVLFIFLVKNYQRKAIANSIFRIVGVVLLALVVIYFMSQLSMFDFVNMRLQNVINQLRGSGVTDRSVRSRALLNQIGVQIFKEHPILGIGIDCPRIPARQATGIDWYLHNNYLEILAGGGLVGFICYYSIYVLLLSRFFRFKAERSPEYDICLVLLILQAVLEFAYVAYYSRETYFYLMMYYLESEIIKDRALAEKECI